MARGRVVAAARRRSRRPCRPSSGPPRARAASCWTPEITSICGDTPPSLVRVRRGPASRIATRCSRRWARVARRGSSRRWTASTTGIVALKIRPVRRRGGARGPARRGARAAGAAAARRAAARARGLLRRRRLHRRDGLGRRHRPRHAAGRSRAPGARAVERAGVSRAGGRGAHPPALAVAAGDPRRRQAGQPDPDHAADGSSSSTSACPRRRTCRAGGPARRAIAPRSWPPSGSAVARQRRLRAGGDRVRAADRLGAGRRAAQLGGHRPRRRPSSSRRRSGSGWRPTRRAARRPRASSSSACGPAGRPALPTGVLTFCFSDIEGSTALWEAHPEAMADALVRHDELIADAVEAHGGSLIESMGEGDSTVSVFDSRAGRGRGRAGRQPRAGGRAVAARHRASPCAGASTPARPSGATRDYFGPTRQPRRAACAPQADGGQIFLSAVTGGARRRRTCRRAARSSTSARTG